MKKIFETEEGIRLEAINEVQAAAFENAGLKEVEEEKKRTSK